MLQRMCVQRCRVCLSRPAAGPFYVTLIIIGNGRESRVLTVSRLDSASLAILDRLNYAVQLLERQAEALGPERSTTSNASQNTPGGSINDTVTQTPTEDLLWTDASRNAGAESSRPLDETEAALSDALNISSRPACTHILEWPIFGTRVRPESIKPTVTGA